jgi:hypothetical protein
VDSLIKLGVVKKAATPGLLLMSDSMQQKKLERWNSFWTKEKKELLKNNIATIVSKIQIQFFCF